MKRLSFPVSAALLTALAILAPFPAPAPAAPPAPVSPGAVVVEPGQGDLFLERLLQAARERNASVTVEVIKVTVADGKQAVSTAVSPAEKVKKPAVRKAAPKKSASGKAPARRTAPLAQAGAPAGAAPSPAPVALAPSPTPVR